MVDTDMPGDDLSVTNVNYTDPLLCQLACNNTPACKGFTYVVRPPLAGSCCLKNGYPALDHNPTCTSGVKPGGGPGPAPSPSTPIPLLPGDTAIDVHLFLDNTFLEVYLMEGRVALTLLLDASVDDAKLALVSRAGGVTATDVNVWHLKPIWSPPEDILAKRRL